MGHHSAQHLSQHTRHERCNPWSSHSPKNGPSLPVQRQGSPLSILPKDLLAPSTLPGQGEAGENQILWGPIQVPQISPWKISPALWPCRHTQV